MQTFVGENQQQGSEELPPTSEEQILLYYKYVELTGDGIQAQIRQWLEEGCIELELKGRVRVARDGLNATLRGSLEAFQIHMDALRSHPLLGSGDPIDFKLAPAQEGADPQVTLETGMGSLSVKLCKEVVSLGPRAAGGAADLQFTGEHLTPEDFHRRLLHFSEASKNQGEEQSGSGGGGDGGMRGPAVLIDARNVYESQIGRFQVDGVETLVPPTRSFSDLPQWLDAHSAELSGRPVLMYCTGGVRCERASAYLRRKGPAFDNVVQLSGGIQRYLDAFPNGGFFRGKNFVFDERICVGAKDAGDPEPISHCVLCSSPSEDYTGRCRCIHCRMLLIVCKKCRTPPTDTSTMSSNALTTETASHTATAQPLDQESSSRSTNCHVAIPTTVTNSAPVGLNDNQSEGPDPFPDGPSFCGVIISPWQILSDFASYLFPSTQSSCTAKFQSKAESTPTASTADSQHCTPSNSTSNSLSRHATHTSTQSNTPSNIFTKPNSSLDTLCCVLCLERDVPLMSPASTSKKAPKQPPPRPTPPRHLDPKAPPRLKVLCLHGFRQNAEKLKGRTNAFYRRLTTLVDLHFIDAPHILPVYCREESSSPAGKEEMRLELSDGVLPSSNLPLRPRRAWLVNPLDQISEQGASPVPPPEHYINGHQQHHDQINGWEASLETIKTALREKGPFDGILGFSQGSAAVSVICALKELEEKNEVGKDFSGKESVYASLRFAILSSGYPSHVPEHRQLYSQAAPISLPSLHVFGTEGNDRQIDTVENEELVSLFCPTTREVVRHGVGHVMPVGGTFIAAYKRFLNRFTKTATTTTTATTTPKEAAAPLDAAC